jgi:hypothetical protein
LQLNVTKDDFQSRTIAPGIIEVLYHRMHIMMSNSQTPSIAGPATRLDRTLKALQDMVKEQEATLKQVGDEKY